MKLYYSKAACSLAPHIILEEIGVPYQILPIDLRKPIPPEFLKINPMGAVPVLILENGQPLTEVAVILQYLADLKPDLSLAPRAGSSMDRYRLQEWLNFIATEIHKGFGPLWAVDSYSDTATQEAIRKQATEDLGYRFDVITLKIGKQPFLLQSGYTVADAYLFAVMSWSNYLKLDLTRWPALTTHMEHVKARSATQRAMQAEHIISPQY